MEAIHVDLKIQMAMGSKCYAVKSFDETSDVEDKMGKKQSS